MTRKEELLKEIANLENEEKRHNELVTFTKATIEGKSFSIPHSSKLYGVNSLHYIHYSNVRVERGDIIVNTRSVNIFWTKSKAQHTTSSLTVQRSYETIRDHGQIYDITSRGKEITLEEFESKWNFTNTKIEIATKSAIALDFPIGNIPAYDDNDIKLKDGELDLPFIILPNSVNHWLTNSVFYTSGKYIMTAGSKRYVK